MCQYMIFIFLFLTFLRLILAGAGANPTSCLLSHCMYWVLLSARCGAEFNRNKNDTIFWSQSSYCLMGEKHHHVPGPFQYSVTVVYWDEVNTGWCGHPNLDLLLLLSSEDPRHTVCKTFFPAKLVGRNHWWGLQWLRTSVVAQMVKCLPTMRETWVRSLGREDPLEKEMATHSSTLARKIPRMEEPGSLESMGLQRVGHDWATSLSLSSLMRKGSVGHSVGKTDRHLWGQTPPRGHLGLPGA